MRRPRQRVIWISLLVISLGWNIWAGWMATFQGRVAYYDLRPMLRSSKRTALLMKDMDKASLLKPWINLQTKYSTCRNQTIALSFFDPPFHKSINQYLNTQLQEQSQNISLQPMCYLPLEHESSSSSSCMTTNNNRYSVIIFGKSRNIRQLFLNIMVLKTYTNVLDVTVIIPDKDYASTMDDLGSRLLQWEKDGYVNLITGNSFWENIAHASPQSEAVLFIDGDQKKSWNATMMKANFKIWKQQCPNLVGFNNDWYVSTTKNCKVGWHIPELHGLFLHQQYLCLLNHQVTDPLREIIENQPWDLARKSITLLWSQVSNAATLAPGTNYLKDPNITSSIGSVLDHFGCCLSSLQRLEAAATNMLVNASNENIYIT